MGDFNSRTALNLHYIENDSVDLNRFNENEILPENYKIDQCSKRNSADKILNNQGEHLLDMCISSGLRILNGRYIGDILGNFTCFTANGSSVVDYAIVSEDLLSSVRHFKTDDLNYLSDHIQIECSLKCNFNIQKI